MVQYLFGYGSLINADSRARTGKTGMAMPARLRGFQRAWNVAARRGKFTAVGITPQPQASCNGVLVEVPPPELSRFDARERHYERVVVPGSALMLLPRDQPPPGTIWTYVMPRPGKPSAACPIVQSYVDVILLGCLRIGMDFAAEFIDTTTGWDNPWLNDRDTSRYQQTRRDVPQAQEIDALLHARLPHALQHRMHP